MAGGGYSPPLKQVIDFSDAPGLQLEATTGITPGTIQVLIDYQVPSGSIVNLRQVSVISRAYGSFKVTLDGKKIGSGKTNPIENNAPFFWSAGYPCTGGQQVVVSYTAIAQTPSGIEVESYLQTTIQ